MHINCQNNATLATNTFKNLLLGYLLDQNQTFLSYLDQSKIVVGTIDISY